MIRDELRQLHYDFSLAPDLAERYTEHEDNPAVVRFIRVVGGVSHYLSRMATGDARIYEGQVFGALGVRMDEVTDVAEREIDQRKFRAALRGDEQVDGWEIATLAGDVARSDAFPEKMVDVARAQNDSLVQFDETDHGTLFGITSNKGGHTGVANLHMVKEDPARHEEQVAYDFGVLMQLLDDYLDQPDDEADGISTLYTEGHFDRSDLEYHRKRVLTAAEKTWGESTASERFRAVTKLHSRAGWLNNETPIDPSWIVPWYL
jgi:hypothetical protein